MVNSPGEIPEYTADSDQETRGQKNQEIIKQIMQKAEQVVRMDKDKGPLAIMNKISEIIDDPSKNDIARKLSLLVAERAPKTLLENEEFIKGQSWADAVKKRAMFNVLDKLD